MIRSILSRRGPCALATVVIAALAPIVRAADDTANYYVDCTKASSGVTGASWSDAFRTLEEAIDAATINNGGVIFIKAGTCYPGMDPGGGATSTDRTLSFVLAKDVRVYGNFDGTEDSLDDRLAHLHAGSYRTYLSGDIGTASDDSDNNHHVVVSVQNGASDFGPHHLDGVTILRGNANLDSDGGGDAGDPTERTDVGGGLFRFNTESSFVLCRFEENHAGEIERTSPPTQFAHGRGGGAWIGASGQGFPPAGATIAPVARLHDCIFLGNGVTGAGTGGGVAIEDPTTDGDVELVNCAFRGNVASGAVAEGVDPDVAAGGAIHVAADASVAIVNCTIFDNAVDQGDPGSQFSGGGGVAVAHGTVAIDNSIIWGNTATYLGDTDASIVFSTLQSTVTVSYCDVEVTSGTWAGTGNINADPLFVSTSGGGLGNLRLQSSSPCVDQGDHARIDPYADAFDIDRDDDEVEAAPSLDLFARYADEVDMGAYERCDADTNGDGRVNVRDLQCILDHWGPTDPGAPCSGDVNDDGEIDVLDLELVLDFWSCGQATWQPRPSAIVDCIEQFHDDPEDLESCIETVLLTGSGS